MIARFLGYLAAAFLAAMMLLTVADVALRTFFSLPIQGMLELVELGLACTIFIALPAVFLRDEHLVVDVVDHLLKPAAVRVLDLIGAIVSLGVLVVIAWQMVPLARTMHEFGDVTSDLSLPEALVLDPGALRHRRLGARHAGLHRALAPRRVTAPRDEQLAIGAWGVVALLVVLFCACRSASRWPSSASAATPRSTAGARRSP